MRAPFIHENSLKGTREYAEIARNRTGNDEAEPAWTWTTALLTATKPQLCGFRLLLRVRALGNCYLGEESLIVSIVLYSACMIVLFHQKG